MVASLVKRYGFVSHASSSNRSWKETNRRKKQKKSSAVNSVIDQMKSNQIKFNSVHRCSIQSQRFLTGCFESIWIHSHSVCDIAKVLSEKNRKKIKKEKNKFSSYLNQYQHKLFVLRSDLVLEFKMVEKIMSQRLSCTWLTLTILQLAQHRWLSAQSSWHI